MIARSVSESRKMPAGAAWRCFGVGTFAVPSVTCGSFQAFCRALSVV